MGKLIVVLPKAGLGNMLLAWARGVVLARKYKLTFTCLGWSSIHWGALLRREKHSRNYRTYFVQDSFSKKVINQIHSRVYKKNILKSELGKISKKIFVSRDFNSSNVMFLELAPHIDILKNELLQMLIPALQQELHLQLTPMIAVHIRRGDFVNAALSTPLLYFKNIIQTLQNIIGTDAPVLIFSDAFDAELNEILRLPNVQRAGASADILDILWMSKARILVLSPSSSFSYWAAFLSNAFVIISEYDWQLKIKESSTYYKEYRWLHNENVNGNLKDELNSFLGLNQQR